MNGTGIDLGIYKDDKLIGKIKISNIVYGVFKNGIVGYSLDKDYQGNGYATEAASEVLRFMFEEVGIDIDLTLANGADKVMAAVLSGDVDIGFSGSEATIYVYNGNEKDYIQTFAQLTQKDGSFLVSRKKIENFNLFKFIFV